MRRADRLFEIIQILRRTRRPISAQEIAGELEVSKRSIYRDIATLLAQRIPIRGEAGVGYVLEAGFDMPPLMLSADEMDAAVLGAMWVSTRAEPELAKAAENLIAKIEAVTPKGLHHHIVETAMSIRPVAYVPDEQIDVPGIRHAIRNGYKIRIGYADNTGNVTERIVWPILLGYRDEGRILAAWCELREGFRYFRTERMNFADITSERYPERSASLRRRWREAMDEERLTYAQTEK